MKTILTGIKPTGIPHLGNYLIVIRPSVKYPVENNNLFFIAAHPALTTLRSYFRSGWYKNENE